MKKLLLVSVACLLLIGAGCPESQNLPASQNTNESQKVSIEDVTQLESETPAEEIPKLSTDSDEDGLTDLQETEVYKTDPLNPDTDGDGYLDGEEVANGYSPTKTAEATTSTTETIHVQETQTKDGVTMNFDITADITTTVNCGPDTSCIEERFDECLPTTLSSDAGFAAVTYEITGPADEGCFVTFVYTSNPNPAWVDQPMYCVFDNPLGFEASAEEAISDAFSGGTSCTGPLVDVVNE